MLARRIIPCLDVKNGRVVKGVNFVGLRDAGDPVEVAARYEAECADEIVFLDITASHEARGIMLEVVRKTAETVFMPLTAGGGISKIGDIREILKAGADKVSINSSAVREPVMIDESARKFGSQCTVVAIDGKKRGEGWEVYIEGGRQPTGKDVVEWAREAEKRGAGEILLTSMDADGTRDGFDIPLTSAVTENVGIPVIASGGAGKAEDFAEVFLEGGADAGLAASIFHYRDITVEEVKRAVAEKGIPVRL